MEQTPGKKEKDEFVALVNEHRKLIYKICRMYCMDKDHIRDIEQEILAGLWTSFPRYDNRYKPSTWVYRIALNTAISYYRKEKKHRINHIAIDESVFSLSDKNDRADFDEQIQQLYGFMDGFSELDRALLLLYLDGNSYEDISGVLGITVTNTATKISRLKKKLKDMFLKIV